MKIKRLNEIENEDKGRKGIAFKVNEDDQTCSSNNKDEIDNNEDMALVQSSPSDISNLVNDNDDLNSLLIEMYHELEKITKKNKELKNKIDNLSNENSKLVCENKTLFESLEVLEKRKRTSQS
ncbi:hypothetical protein M9H77_07932 [Catharanthus roseus]|uniref:Uncharacterized protein n=1 Tax=Catharanthus roseus TaxID=4058 RepID=A0ACC0BWK7_CATRO|nr:hypothetical protein M9H77_07932 [Catharanthus roseus]